MVTLILKNNFVTIKGASRSLIRNINSVTSYKVAGCQFTKSFKKGFWDGRKRLLKFSNKHGYRCPSGLLQDIIRLFEKDEVEYKIKNLKTKPKKLQKKSYGWNDKIKLRPYQVEAINAATTSKKRTKPKARGILVMPIRSGKTITAAGIIRKLRSKALFVVPSQLLLHQTKESLENVLMTDVGMIGDSHWYEHNITVATVQSLARAKKKNDPRYKTMKKQYPLLIFDETHHLVADSWQDLAFDMDAPHIIGLSATVEFEDDKQNELGVIWLRAVCGDILYKISPSTLIDQGYLQQPIVQLYKVESPDMFGYSWSGELANECIYQNPVRNLMIAKITMERLDAGDNVLIVTNRLNQVQKISELLGKMNIDHWKITGKNTVVERREKIQSFKDGEVNVIVGTVFGEGVDIPEIVCVINAEGGADVKATKQRMRNLTTHENKRQAIFIDFMDMTNHYFAQHSKGRLNIYKSEASFILKVKTI